MCNSNTENITNIKDKPNTLDNPSTWDNQNTEDNANTEINPSTQETLLAVTTMGPRVIWLLVGTQWKKLSDVPDECADIGVCICGVSDGIIMFGGYASLEGDKSCCYHFSVVAKQWKRLKDVPMPLTDASAVEFDDMRVLVVGGVNAAGIALGTCMVLDVRHNTWSQVASLPNPMSDSSIAAVAEKVFILRNISLLHTFDNQFSVYDPSTNTHEPRSRLPGNMSNTEGACLVGVNYKVYVFGGKQSLALEYNPLSNQWVQLAPPNLRYLSYMGCCRIVTKSGDILLYGGTTGGRNDMIEEYNPSHKKWKTLDIRLPFEYDYFVAHVTTVTL